MQDFISIEPISLDLIRQYIAQTKREGMAGYSEKADYYGAFFNGELAGFTSIQYYGNQKVKFNNHYVFRNFRGRGVFKEMFAFSLQKIITEGYKTIIASCTSMSLNYYRKHGAVVTKYHKICTDVIIKLT
jgi:predicted GNAT family acetyltransferase